MKPRIYFRDGMWRVKPLTATTIGSCYIKAFEQFQLYSKAHYFVYRLNNANS